MARPPHQFDRAANAAAAEAREQGRRRDAGLVHFGGDLRRTNNYTCDPFGAPQRERPQQHHHPTLDLRGRGTPEVRDDCVRIAS